MSLTILNVAYPLAPVSPDAVGGAEQFVATLDREIERAGHHSLVLAAQGSAVCGTLIPSPRWEGPIDSALRKRAAGEHSRLISAILRTFVVDVVHLHGLDFFDYLPPEPVPCLAELHLPPQWYPAAVFETETTLICVSNDQRSHCPASAAPIRTIPHGIDIAAFSPAAIPGDYALMLGRICPEKGFHYAIEAAETAGMPLLIAGQVYPYPDHQAYFRSAILPRLNHRIRFLGAVGLREKARLLAHARCVLIPSTVAETSSLVAMEALASGTPVIAFPSGALKEIVEEGITGFLVNDAPQMAERIQRAGAISRKVCRLRAETRFSLHRMMKSYFDLYTEVSVGTKLVTRGSALK